MELLLVILFIIIAFVVIDIDMRIMNYIKWQSNLYDPDYFDSDYPIYSKHALWLENIDLNILKDELEKDLKKNDIDKYLRDEREYSKKLKKYHSMIEANYSIRNSKKSFKEAYEEHMKRLRTAKI